MANEKRSKTTAEKLEAFLVAGGAAILEPTNEYEIARFRTSEGLGVIYRSKHGVSFRPASNDHITDEDVPY